ncbi:MAG: hypothetical protein MUF64_15765 [Polyangiaceae bacterium]|nr:hypothetical protein [Polyangiaceae bacterium]
MRDARQLGVAVPELFLLEEGQVIYAGASPVEVRLRGWRGRNEDGEQPRWRTPWSVGGSCLVQSERDGLRLMSSSSGLHHRSLRVQVREGGLVMLGAWSLPAPTPPPQLSLAFEAPAPVVGKAMVELLRAPAPHHAAWRLVG